MTQSQRTASSTSETLNVRQQAIVPIAAFAAAGNIARLNTALSQGLHAGLTVSDVQEVLIQVYAYAGFPRSLNALGELMKVVEARKKQGIQDPAGRAPNRPVPKGDALMAAGTANQTKLSGGPVSGPLFDFAPTANQFLRAHLFGDIFERDNLDWHSRELATVAMLSALPGAEPQLLAHMRISMNIGIPEGQIAPAYRGIGRPAGREHGRPCARRAGAAHCTPSWREAVICSGERLRTVGIHATTGGMSLSPISPRARCRAPRRRRCSISALIRVFFTKPAPVDMLLAAVAGTRER